MTGMGATTVKSASAAGRLAESSFAVVTDPVQEQNHRVLQPVLTDLIAYSLLLKQLHWNVTGPNFRPIHQHLDEIHGEVMEAVDSVAERLAATGHSPDGTVQSVSRDSELGETPTGFLPDVEVLKLAAYRTHELTGLVRSRMEAIEDKDTVTADLLHQVVEGLEKHHWMLRAQLTHQS